MSARSDCTVHIVDDDDSSRAALARLLKVTGFPVRTFASAEAFMLAEPDPGPRCLLLDLEMPGIDGLALQQALRGDGASVPIVFISAYRDIPRAVRAMKGGAVEFLLKPLDTTALLAALDHAAALAAAAVPLSTREETVLRGILAGRLNKQIAADLSLSERTIKLCRSGLMTKLGARSLADLVQRGGDLVQR